MQLERVFDVECSRTQAAEALSAWEQGAFFLDIRTEAEFEGRRVAGAMPLKVVVKERATVTAGLAKEVEAVNQYPALMNSPTA